jgi:alpha-mannosidase
MRTSLAHQNPLHAVKLGRAQDGPLALASASLLGIDAPNVVVTAVKPAEEAERGLVVRAWELDGTPTSFSIDASALHPSAVWSTTLVESDREHVPVTLNGRIQVSLGPRQIGAWRFLGGAPEPDSATLSAMAAVALGALAHRRINA